MKILIGGECNGKIRDAFIAKGHDAISCDLKDTIAPGPHYKGDMMDIINDGFDIGIFHPPCTYISRSSVQWLSHPADRHLPFIHRRDHPLYPGRRKKAMDAIEFAKKIWASKIPKLVIENPIGLLSRWKKPSQIVEPWMFGDEYKKPTCLWIRGLPLLTPTNIVGQGDIVITKSGKKIPKWYSSANLKERGATRSVTFDGIAKAMADQWG